MAQSQIQPPHRLLLRLGTGMHHHRWAANSVSRVHCQPRDSNMSVDLIHPITSLCLTRQIPTDCCCPGQRTSGTART